MSKYIRLLGVFTISILLLTGCIEEPEFKGMSGFKIDHINKEEVVFDMDIEIYNPNKFKINIRKSTFDLFLNDEYIGKAHLTQKYKMAKNTSTTATVPIQIEFGQGVLFKLLSMSLKQSINARISGKLKVTASGIPASRKIDKTKNINPEEFGIDLKGILN